MPETISTPATHDHADAVITIHASSVTGAQSIPVEVPRTLPAEAVAESVADIMSLPSNVPWTLRDDTSSAFLTDGVAIGDQLAPGARVRVTPKTHLG